MRAVLLLWVVALLLQCQPPAMNPSLDSDPIRTPGKPSPSPAPSPSPSPAPSPNLPTKLDAAAPKTAVPPLTSPNPSAKDAGASQAEPQAPPRDDDEALRRLGEYAQTCVDERRISLDRESTVWVRLQLRVHADGTVVGVVVTASSGVDGLDGCALDSARKSRFPPSDSDRVLDAPLGFRGTDDGS